LPFLLTERVYGEVPYRVLLSSGEDGRLQQPGISQALAALDAMWSMPAFVARVELGIQACDATAFRERLAHHGADAEALELEPLLASLQARADRIDPALAGALRHLLAHRPPASARPVLCHADVQPLNVILRHGEVAGVVDWVNLRIADREFEVGRTRVLFRAVPMPLPIPETAVDLLGRLLAGRYLRTHRASLPCDPRRLRFYEALRCVEIAIDQAENAALAEPRRLTWNDPRAFARIGRHFARITGQTFESFRSASKQP
ncbi:MAG: phosphotransferase, partial [Holophagales bacterium]|nr:phosphotransferase [Holophagales bacterium]